MKKWIFLILLSFVLMTLYIFHHPGNYRVTLDNAKGFICSRPGEIHYEAWGPNGMSKSCVRHDGVEDGSFIGLDYGHVSVIGTMKNGHQVGLWVYLSPDGKPRQILDFGNPDWGIFAQPPKSKGSSK
jgi:hypothetical protein